MIWFIVVCWRCRTRKVRVRGGMWWNKRYSGSRVCERVLFLGRVCQMSSSRVYMRSGGIGWGKVVLGWG